jgi:hypothetical protein
MTVVVGLDGASGTTAVEIEIIADTSPNPTELRA